MELAPADEGEEVVWDYAATGLTLRRHPLAILRPKLAKLGWKTAADLPTGRWARVCGIVTVRQQPETAKGMALAQATPCSTDGWDAAAEDAQQ